MNNKSINLFIVLILVTVFSTKAENVIASFGSSDTLSYKEFVIDTDMFGDSVIKKDSNLDTKFLPFAWTQKAMDFVTIERPTHSLAFYPAFGYDPYTGFIFGVMPVFTWYGDNGRSSTILPELTYSTKKQIRAKVEADIFTNNKWNISGIGQYVERYDDWFGIGLDREPDTLGQIKSKRIAIEGSVTKGFNNLYIGITGDVTYFKIDESEGDSFNETVPGYDGGLAIGVGPIVRFDKRDNVVFPTRGLYAEASVKFYNHNIGSDFDFVQYKLDVREYISIVNKKNVLALQTLWTISENGTVPFFKMPIMSDDNYLRGISHPFKYLDNNMWLLQAEYRRDLWWRFSAAVWAGAGNTFHDMDDKVFCKTKYVYGVGGRFNIDKKEKINLRLDVGFGSHRDKGIYLSFKEAF